MPAPNRTDTTSIEQPEGIIDLREAIKIDLTDDKILRIIGKRIDDGKTFYDSNLKLKDARENNEKRWMGKNREVAGLDVYEHQLPYEDNRIFVSVETLAASLVPRFPIPEVVEAQDTDASRELASGFEKVLLRTAEDLQLRAKLRMVARHLLMGYRVGIMKQYWDFDAGRTENNGEAIGGPVSTWIRPHKVVFDADATDPDDIPLIAENMSATVQELIRKFPNKKDKIKEKFHDNSDKTSLGTRIGYWEIWFTFYHKGKRHEGVAWKYHDLLLEWGLNPYWNYTTGENKSNFLDRPHKPYVLFNFLRIGRWVYDDTSLTEQAGPLQDILEKRGLQIVDNADQANAAKIFNTDQINPRDAEKYVGDPNDNIMVTGDVRTAFARVGAPPLSSYVLEDKYDARREIDNIFGTHAPLRGEKTKSPTLGQEIISQRADLGRTATLTEAMEEGSTQVFKQLTQLYKVFAKEEHIVKYVGEDGKTVFVNFSKDKIEDGIEIRVRAGSLEPEDKLSDRNEAVELAKTGKLIDPLTFAEKWHIAKPIEHAKRSFYWLFMPDRFAQEILKIGEPGQDPALMSTINRINAGDVVPAKEDASKEYVAGYAQFLQSPAFQQLDPEVQRLHVQHARETMMAVQGSLKSKRGGSEKGENIMSRIVARLRREKT